MSFNINKPTQQELLNQGKLITKSFALGLIKPKFYQSNDTGSFNQRTLEEQAREEGKNGAYNGFFGLPVFDILTLIGFNYTTLDGKRIVIADLNLGVALIDVSQSKNEIETPIQGRNGTIKEYISDGDYVLNIRGVIASNAQDSYPEDLVKHLIQFCNAPVSIPVASNLLDLFGIHNIVIKDFAFPQNEGMRNVVNFQLSCLSDTPFEIKTKTQV